MSRHIHGSVKLHALLQPIDVAYRCRENEDRGRTLYDEPMSQCLQVMKVTNGSKDLAPCKPAQVPYHLKVKVLSLSQIQGKVPRSQLRLNITSSSPFKTWSICVV